MLLCIISNIPDMLNANIIIGKGTVAVIGFEYVVSKL